MTSTLAKKNAIFLPRFHGKFALTMRGKSNGKKISLVNLDPNMFFASCYFVFAPRICVGNERGKGDGGGKSGIKCLFAENKLSCVDFLFRGIF